MKRTIGTMQVNITETAKPALIRYCENQIKQKLYPIILVVGRQRTGKTAMALWLAEQIAAFRGVPFEVEKDLFLSVEDMATRYSEAKRKVFILDEASIALFAMESLSVEQRVFTKILHSQAYLENILIIVLPNAKALGKYHADEVTGILLMRGRGFYTFYAPIKSYHEFTRKKYYFFEVETLGGIPLPSAKTWRTYMTVGKARFKEDIMESQMEVLSERKLRQEKAKIMQDLRIKRSQQLAAAALGPAQKTDVVHTL